MSPILEVKNLTIEFGDEKIIDNLSFSLEPKDVLVILGPNGAGKTVLLKALLGLLPHKGETVWKDNVKIGYVPQKIFQTRDLPLTVEDFFKFKKTINQSGKSEKDKIIEALNLVGIKQGDALKEQLATLSSGQLQRVLIAWAIIESPEVLLFDEPTAGIDLEGEETIYNLLKNLWKKRGMTAILVSHDLSVVYRHATKVLCLNKRKICYGPPKEILNPKILKSVYGEEISFHQHA